MNRQGKIFFSINSRSAASILYVHPRNDVCFKVCTIFIMAFKGIQAVSSFFDFLKPCTVCSEKFAPALDHPNEMPTYRIFSPLFSDRLTT